ncbi:MAG: Mandelate racemase/muconate lactonizing protein [Gammaproteobacteria bacterium]|nr:Mandelate racemase/muconate lactonizing protein [Gammaproteobacteria bacterium]
MTRILNLQTHDLRFPTSIFLDGSDAMNPDPDYSAAYVILSTDHPQGLAGHGFTFTIGRGNELCVAAIEAYRPFIVGRSLEEIVSNMSAFWRSLAGDSQLRWLGPEKGVIHLALAAILNAVWDLWAKSVGKPVWKLVADLTPEQFVSLIDFRHIEDVLTPKEGLEILHRQAAGKATREQRLRAEGYPAYTTSVGWLGYDDDKVRRLCREYVAQGWHNFKIKVGRDLSEDLRRCALVRQEIGPDRRLMIDANQVWEVNAAIPWLRALCEFDPWWIEEPVSPDDILGHRTVARAVRPMRVATGEHVHNRIMFKQLLASGAIEVVQPDPCRLGGLNEVLAVLLLAAKFGKPVCPHAGGVGLCEYAQHISMIDFVVVSGSWQEAMCEHTQHLHEHFVHPIEVDRGRYRVPLQPGFSAEMRSESIAEATHRG